MKIFGKPMDRQIHVRRLDAQFFNNVVRDHEVLFIIFQAAASTYLRFRVRMFRMHGPQWNNTRIILTDARYPAIDAFYLVRTGDN
jgi:hypothetical protein